MTFMTSRPHSYDTYVPRAEYDKRPVVANIPDVAFSFASCTHLKLAMTIHPKENEKLRIRRLPLANGTPFLQTVQPFDKTTFEMNSSPMSISCGCWGVASNLSLTNAFSHPLKLASALLLPLIVIAMIKRITTKKGDHISKNQTNGNSNFDLDDLCSASRSRIISTDESRNNTFKPYEHGVVLLGGLGDGPAYWDRLLPHLKRQVGKIPKEQTSTALIGTRPPKTFLCYAPRTPGWDEFNLRKVRHVSYKNWVTQGQEAISLAKSLCSRVTVVGHYTGALVAAAVTEAMDVDRLVFTGANFLPSSQDLKIKNLLLSSFIGRKFLLLKSIIVKCLKKDKPTGSSDIGRYYTENPQKIIPFDAMRQTFKLQDKLSRPWRVKEVIVLMGEDDQSAAPLSQQMEHISRFVPNDARCEAHLVTDAAHNLCWEGDHALFKVAEAINQPPSNAHHFFSIRE